MRQVYRFMSKQLILFFLFLHLVYSVQAQVQFPTPDLEDKAAVIVALDEQALAYLEDEGIGMMNLSAKRLTPANYFSIHPLEDNMYAVQIEENGQYALMNSSGRLLTPYDYTHVGKFVRGKAVVQRANSSTHKTEYAIVSNEGLVLSDWLDSIAITSGDGGYVFRHDGQWGVWSRDSSFYFQQDFQDIGVFNAGLAPAVKNGKYGFVSNAGSWKIKPVYQKAQPFQGKYAAVKMQGDQWQLINRSGESLLSQTYDSIRLYRDGAYTIVEDEEKASYLNFNAKPLTDKWYDAAQPFGEDGIARAKANSKEMYISTTGKEIFEADSLQTFKNGRGIFLKDKKWGWVNEEGREIVVPQFDEVLFSTKEKLVVKKDNKIFLVDGQGKVIQEIHADRKSILLTEEALIFEQRPTFYLVDLLRSKYQQLQYDEVGDISDGAIVVKKDGRYGYVDINGQEVIPPENVAASFSTDQLLFVKRSLQDGFVAYDKELKIQFQLPKDLFFLGPFQSGRAKVMNAQGLMGFIDRSGHLVVPCKYPLVGDYHYGKAIYRSVNGLFGYLNTDGKEVIPAVYQFVSDFDVSGYAAVVKDQKFGFIDEKGGVTIAFQYDMVLSLSNGVASVKKDGKVGYVNMQNKVLVPFTFDEAYQSEEGLALVKVGKYWGYINDRGKVRIPWQFVEAQAFSEGRAWAKLSNRFGLIDSKGAYLTAFSYDQGAPFENGYAKVRVGDKWGIVNINGSEIIPPVCDNISKVEQQKVVVQLFSQGYGIQLFKK